jgi:3D (Asp-Asp-Asp) domain-containing protein
MKHPIATTIMFSGIALGIVACTDDMMHINKRTVTATAYTSHANQTDSTPFIPACGGDLRDGRRAIAVSADLFRHSLKCGVQVRINGDTWTVRDRMNNRFINRIDLYAGMDLHAARKFGKRAVKIEWRDL